MTKVQPNIGHLDRRQPTEVEVNSEDEIDALARTATPRLCKVAGCGTAARAGWTTCAAHDLRNQMPSGG